jgi:hypothetical protein
VTLERHRCFVADMLTGAVREEVALQNVTYTDRLKAPATLDASISFRDPKATPQNFNTETTSLIMVRDGIVQFAGPLVTIQLGSNANLLSLQAHDRWGFVRRRKIRSRQGMAHASGTLSTDIRFEGVDQLHIVDDLVAHMQSVSGGDLGITVAYDALSGVTRDREYQIDDFIGQRIEELASVESGFDWSLDVAGSINDLANITHTLRLHYPMRGRNTGYVLSWDGGTNMLGMAFTESSRDRAQRFVAIGDGEGTAQARFAAEDPNLLGVLPLLEASSAFTGVKEQATIEAHARRGLALNSRAAKVPTFTLDPDAEPRWGTYITGDIVRAAIADGWVQYSGLCRINARSLTIGEDGAATASVELAELARFS